MIDPGDIPSKTGVSPSLRAFEVRTPRVTSAAPRCAIYCRAPAEAQTREGTGLADQEAKCRGYAAARRWTVVGVWSDVGNGIDTDRLPGLSALGAAVQRGEVDIVAVVRFDRLSREAEPIHRLLFEFRGSGVRVVSVNEGNSKAFIGVEMSSDAIGRDAPVVPPPD
jgi:hypothetical protein